ncbi:unnamed protein product [Larinioides sclopetarius]|uniref:Uncharacterized protein n=1 Tax=Larinioides sclopetarius TaxID=280406 RepID=A0AAV2BHC5_9ARAC
MPSIIPAPPGRIKLLSRNKDANQTRSDPTTVVRNNLFTPSEQSKSDIYTMTEEPSIVYFRNLLEKNKIELKNYCEDWEKLINGSDIPEVVCDEIRTTIGLTNLLLQQKLKQFAGLIDDSEFKRGGQSADFSFFSRISLIPGSSNSDFWIPPSDQVSSDVNVNTLTEIVASAVCFLLIQIAALSTGCLSEFILISVRSFFTVICGHNLLIFTLFPELPRWSSDSSTQLEFIAEYLLLILEERLQMDLLSLDPTIRSLSSQRRIES